MAYVYILKSHKNGAYYIGSTDNIERRMQEHNAGKSKYTSLILPIEMVFKQEFVSLSHARSVERRLKQFKSKEIIERIINDGYIKTTRD